MSWSAHAGRVAGPRGRERERFRGPKRCGPPLARALSGQGGQRGQRGQQRVAENQSRVITSPVGAEQSPPNRVAHRLPIGYPLGKTR